MNETKARDLVAARSGGTCELCRSSRAGSWAHRLPRGQGGLWAPSNGLHLCGTGTTGCHGWSERNRLASYASGWLLMRGVDPVATPAWIQPAHLPSGWYLLDDEGCFRWMDWVALAMPQLPEDLPPWARDALVG